MLWEFQFRCSHLDRKDLLSKTDPFIQLGASLNPTKHAGKKGKKEVKKQKDMKKAAKGKAASWSTVFKSETVMNNQNPTFKPFQIDLRQLCQGNMDTPFQIAVYVRDCTWLWRSELDFSPCSVVSLFLLLLLLFSFFLAGGGGADTVAHHSAFVGLGRQRQPRPCRQVRRHAA